MVRRIEGLRGYEGLAVAIIHRSLLDLESSSPRLRADAKAFFDSTWFTDLKDFTDLPPDWRPR